MKISGSDGIGVAVEREVVGRRRAAGDELVKQSCRVAQLTCRLTVALVVGIAHAERIGGIQPLLLKAEHIERFYARMHRATAALKALPGVAAR